MNIAKIKRIEQQDDFSVVTLEIPAGMSVEDFDSQQLGGFGEEWESPTIISTDSWDENEGTIMATGVKLKVGDAITLEEGGEPMMGDVRKEAQQKKFSIVKEHDYRDEFAAKHGQDRGTIC